MLSIAFSPAFSGHAILASPYLNQVR